MGFLDRFSKDGRDQRAREKNAARAINKYAQSPDRLKAMQELRDDGSAEALYALMRRFGMMYDKTIEDEQEKEWAFELARSRKARLALPALKKYMISADSISVAAAPAGQGRRREGRTDRRHRRGARPPRAGL